MDRDRIDAALAVRLVAAQFPQWTHLPVAPVEVNGWDNRTFRLGGELTVRLPTAQGYVPSVHKEHTWLPRLAPRLPLPIPEPVALGAPGQGYPWPWSVRRWIDGHPATPDRIADLDTFARDLAGFPWHSVGSTRQAGPTRAPTASSAAPRSTSTTTRPVGPSPPSGPGWTGPARRTSGTPPSRRRGPDRRSGSTATSPPATSWSTTAARSPQ